MRTYRTVIINFLILVRFIFFLTGSYDFLGMNFYTSNIATHATSTEQGYFADADVSTYKDPSWLG